MEESLEEPMLIESRAVNVTKSPDFISPSEKDSLSSWIKQNIKKKECCFYVKNKSTGFCMCGYPKDKHAGKAVEPDGFVEETRDKHEHMKEVSTDAYGEISFGGKYVRVSTDTSMDVLYQLMTDHWKLRPPNLLISVMGRTQNFYLRTRLKKVFHRGLIKVAQTTGAWILTGGTHRGVVTHVGQAVRDYALNSGSMAEQIVTIGVATWGIVANRDTLVNPEGCFPAQYSVDQKDEGLSTLDVNHSHFLLVDDGTHGRYRAEVNLRSKLQKHISQQPLGNKESGLTVPVVCVVLDGGEGTLDMIYNAVLNETPCVILEGSGRLADIIAQVAEQPKVTTVLIRQLMRKLFGQEFQKFGKIDPFDWTKKIQDILRTPQLLSVFRINEEGQSDLDVAILRALFKASRSPISLRHVSWEQELELAMAWNRLDIAKSEMFTMESQWKSSDLHRALRSALVGHKPDFVKLLLENGVSLREFLTEDTLADLYNHLEPGCLFLRRLAKRMRSEEGCPCSLDPPGRSKVCLHRVSDEVRHYLGSFTEPICPTPACCCIKKEEIRIKFPPNEATALLQNPGSDLFLWAILQNRRELAEIAWAQCRDSMCAALAASKILKKMAQEEVDEGDESDKMRELADYYEKQAIGVFSECYSHDKQRAQKLLIRISRYWGGTTCLRLALEADDKRFVAHAGVQGLLTQIWCGELAVENPQWKMLLCMLFPPLICTGLLAFRRDEDIKRENQRKERILSVESVTRSSASAQSCDCIKATDLQTCRSRLVRFFSSSQIKFYWNMVSYFSFLWLFAYVLMMDFQNKPSWKEYLLYGWLVSLVCEEMRQLLDDPEEFGFWRKCKIYITDLWNILDVLAIVLFIIGLICRLTTGVFYVGKIVLCIDFMVFCLRLMAIFIINKTLGPKIIIVRRMMKDLFFFMFLLSIWVVAYGVANQGILIHNEGRLNWIIRGMVYEPYLILFGNVPTSIDHVGFDPDKCCKNGTDPMKPKCPILNANGMPVFPGWLTITLLCIYLLIANILLLNLLIAIFNYTFEVVQENTDMIWKFQRYELIKEYSTRPPLPPPFILLSHLDLCIRQPPKKHKQFKMELQRKEEEEVLSWEARMKENYLASSQRDLRHSMERRIQDTSNKVGVMVDLLEGEHDRRLAHLEEQVSQCAKALQSIMDTLRSHGYKTKEEAPVLCELTGSLSERPEILRSASSLDVSPCPPMEMYGNAVGRMPMDTCQAAPKKEEVKEKTEYHNKAQHLHHRTIRRFPAPDKMEPWEVEFADYDPPVYNADEKIPSAQSQAASRGNRGETGLSHSPSTGESDSAGEWENTMIPGTHRFIPTEERETPSWPHYTAKRTVTRTGVRTFSPLSPGRPVYGAFSRCQFSREGRVLGFNSRTSCSGKGGYLKKPRPSMTTPRMGGVPPQGKTRPNPCMHARRPPAIRDHRRFSDSPERPEILQPSTALDVSPCPPIRMYGKVKATEYGMGSMPTDTYQAAPKKQEFKEKMEYHVNARDFQYPDSAVKRFPVPDELVPWEVEFADYDPPVYNADEKTPSAQSEEASSSEIYLDRYRNPRGRTGLKGKGALNHLGPNQVLDPILTRWKDESKSALEFLAVWDKKEGVWTIPGGPVSSNEILPQRMEKILGRKLHEQIKYKLAHRVEVNEVYSGYADDQRNTDNAWVEISAFNIHLDRGSLLVAQLNSVADSSRGSPELVQWQEVNERMSVYAYQRELLRMVAELHGRHF